jgi:hypothetical protein
VTEREHQAYMTLIDNKARNNIELTQEERKYYCGCIDYKSKRNLSICDDRNFYELYLQYYFSEQDYTKFDNLKKNDFLEFVTNWEEQVKITNHSEKLMQIVSKEARDTLKKVIFNQLREYLFQYKNRKIKICAFSKCVYIKVKSFSLDLRPISVQLGGQYIDIDEYSLVHIYFRHFAELVKPFDTGDKSFFSETVHYDDLPYFLQRVFTKINGLGLPILHNFYDLNFRIQGIDYKVYFKKVTKQVAGDGNIYKYRVNTFYPIESEKDRNKLKGYHLAEIDSDLSVYIENDT